MSYLLKLTIFLPALLIFSYLPLTYAKPATPSLSDSSNATICNTTENDVGQNNAYGKTNIAVIFSARGCAAINHGQTYVCSAQFNITPGQCASYHFKGGTSARHAEVGLPFRYTITGAVHDWNFGDPGSHFNLNAYNGYTASVKRMGFDDPGEKLNNYVFGMACDGNGCWNIN